uniref:Actin-related protein 2/3 complex subunit n=1 Tax=Panagrellus redivivus TaxID=6233 RepID=A0A7E4VXN9_PANRE
MPTPPLQFKLGVGPILSHAFNADRSQVAVASDNCNLYIFERKNNKWEITHTLCEHDQPLTGVDWCPKTNRIVTCADDKNAYVWTFENGKWNACLVLLRVKCSATCVKWSPNENKFAVGTAQKLVAICYYEKEHNWWVAKHIKTDINSTVRTIAWHPGNVLLAVGSFDRYARVFSAYVKEVEEKPSPLPWGAKMSFGATMASYPVSGFVKAVAFSPSGHRLVIVTHDATCNVVDANEDLHRVVTYYGKELTMRSVMWINENEFVAGGDDQYPILYEYTGKEVRIKKAFDVFSEKPKNKVLSAFAKFRNLDDLDTENPDDGVPQPLHTFAITDIIPFKGTASARTGVTDISSVSHDGQMIVWPIQATLDYLNALLTNSSHKCVHVT